jgi:hypothetical protein
MAKKLFDDSSNEGTSANDELQQALELLLEPNTWFRFPCYLLLIMTPSEAVFYGALLDHAGELRKYHKLPASGWFYFTAKDIMDTTLYQPRNQRRIIKKLREKGVVETRWDRRIAKRMFKFNHLKLWKMIKAERKRMAKERENNRQKGYEDGHDPSMF